jgi:hypothetical protein
MRTSADRPKSASFRSAVAPEPCAQRWDNVVILCFTRGVGEGSTVTYVKEDVVELQVSVHDTQTVQVVAAHQDLLELLGRHHLVVVHGLRQVVVQVAAVHQLQNDPQTLGGLIQLVHRNNVSVADALHDLDLRAHALRVVHAAVLLHDLTREHLPSHLVGYLVHLAGGSVTQNLADLVGLLHK